MAEAQVSQEGKTDAVSTTIGVVHVLPSAYQGGVIPEGSKARVPEASKKEAAKKAAPVSPVKPVPQPVVKRPPEKPKPPVQNPHKKRVLWSVGGVVVFVLLVMVGVAVWMAQKTREVNSTPVIPVVQVTDPVETPAKPVDQNTSSDETPEPEPVEVPLVPGRDTDSDGLTDIEELLYGSNVRLPDTDQDGFLDGNEVFHGYDPATADPATLLDRRVVVPIQIGSVTSLVPALWTSQELGEGRVEVKAPSGEIVTFALVPAASGTTLQEVVQNLARQTADTGWLEGETSVSKQGSALFTRTDRLGAVVAVGEMVVEVTYDVASKRTMDFVQTLQMMINQMREQTSV